MEIGKYYEPDFLFFFLESQLLNICITPKAKTIGKGYFAFYFVAVVSEI